MLNDVDLLCKPSAYTKRYSVCVCSLMCTGIMMGCQNITPVIDLSLIFTHRAPVWYVFAGSLMLFDHPFEYHVIGCEPCFISIRRCFVDSDAWSLWEKCHPRLRPIPAHHTVIKPGVPVCLHRSRAWSHWTFTSAIATSRAEVFNRFRHSSVLGGHLFFCRQKFLCTY